MKNFLRFLCFSLMMSSVYADTIQHYMNVADSIPKMEMKADSDAQIWVRSARNILNLTCEAIAETLTAANRTATEQGKPLFCLNRAKEGLDPEFLNKLIQKTYTESNSPKEVKDSMTVSEIALIGLMQKYPCTPDHASSTSQNAPAGFPSFGDMKHVSG